MILDCPNCFVSLYVYYCVLLSEKRTEECKQIEILYLLTVLLSIPRARNQFRIMSVSTQNLSLNLKNQITRLILIYATIMISDNDEGEKFHLNLAIDINGLPFGKTAVSSKYI